MTDIVRSAGQMRNKELLLQKGSPSTGSEDGAQDNVQDDFDPFQGDEEENVNQEISAPPENQWYHGRLDRHAAEDRLRSFGRVGSYLVRESDRKPGSYVLSYLGRSGMNHFRVTAVCGDFYIGGRQFSSLVDLVAYYTHLSDLLKRERLMQPVPPPEPVNDHKKVIAILPYTKMPDTDELTFQKGDIFFVHNDMGDNWLWVTAHRTGEQGMIFHDLVDEIGGDIDPNKVFSWFHPDITKQDAVDMLVKAGPGSFLVRPSDNSPGDYSLFFHINNQIQRFRIEKKGVRYLMGGRVFECLDSVISRYKVEQIVEGHTLGNPVLKSRFEQERLAQEMLEIENAEKVYATLRECREQSGLKKAKGIKMQGYLTKRGEKIKKWKSFYFVLQLEGTDTHLYYFDNPKRTKPKGLYDLSCSYLYTVHDTFLDRPYCFQLVERALPCLATTIYLSANNEANMQEWINVIRPCCVSQMHRAPKVHKLKELRCLHICIMKAQRLPVKLVPAPFCVVSLNQGVKMCRTKVKSGSDPIWEEEFFLDDLPPDVLSFTVTLYNKGKRSKDVEVAEVTVDLNTLTNGDEDESWHPLLGVTPVGEWGSLRMRVRYMYDLIMPLEEYSPLQELVIGTDISTGSHPGPDLACVHALASCCHLDRLALATALLRIFRFEKKECTLLVSLNESEISKEEDTSVLFRAASLTTTLMDLYMKSVCTGFLQAALSPVINMIMEAKQSCELNTLKMDNPDEACANAEYLLQVLDHLTDSIFMSAETCPRTLRYICHCLQRAVLAKWPNERLVKTRVVSGFIFLRLLCPAILNPRQFNLMPDMPHNMATRSLMMLAKCLQNLANLVEFGAKEPYMEVVNPFILKNKEKMIVFLDTLSSIKDRPEPEDARLKGDLAQDLGTVHHICVSHIKELNAEAKVQVLHSPSGLTLKKLVTVTDMLSKHKKRYMEMIS